jgi:hypothetical protein
MKRVTVFLFAAIFAVGCASTSMTSYDNAAGSDELRAKTPSHYRLLSDPDSIREINWGRPLTALHVKGYLTSQGFVPVSKVEGRGGLCKGGDDSWLSLKDGQIHSNGEAASGPHVKGCVSSQGGFRPSTKEVTF